MRPKVVVIAWDMSHNAAGRAYLLADMLSSDYDVMLVGAIFARFGSLVWPPLTSSNIQIRTFKAESLSDFMRSAEDFLSEITADVVIACKPRLPSIVLALLLKGRLDCPILIDVDDHELAFFKDASPLSISDARSILEQDPEAADQPYSREWTRLADSLICTFEARTVSNMALQQRVQGTIVRHARDERLYAPSAEVRSRVRSEFGYKQDDKVILFLGSPRGHKGIVRIADSLRRLRDGRLALCVIGTTTAKSILRHLTPEPGVRIDLFPDQPWKRLPELSQIADCVCLLQDEASPVAQFQAPAKLSDALAVGTPVAVTDVPPFSDIPPDLVAVVRSDEDLDNFLRSIAEADTCIATVERRRDYFRRELSYDINRARLEAVLSRAEASAIEWREEWSQLLELVGTLSGWRRPTWLGQAPAPQVH